MPDGEQQRLAPRGPSAVSSTTGLRPRRSTDAALSRSVAGSPVRRRKTSSRRLPAGPPGRPGGRRARPASAAMVAMAAGRRRRAPRTYSAGVGSVTGHAEERRPSDAVSMPCGALKRISCRRCGAQLGRRPGGGDLAAVDDHDVVGQPLGLVELVGGEQHAARPGRRGRAMINPHDLAAADVDPSRRLVEEHHLRAGRRGRGRATAAAARRPTAASTCWRRGR